MKKRELNISDKNITINTYQDIALHSGEGEQKMGEINDI